MKPWYRTKCVNGFETDTTFIYWILYNINHYSDICMYGFKNK